MVSMRTLVGMLWVSSTLALYSFAAAPGIYEIAMWEAGTAMPTARGYFGMVHIPPSSRNSSTSRGHVMVAGGKTSSAIYGLDSVYVYDVDARTWSGPAAAMPVARYAFGMVHIPSVDGVGRGQVMVAGGHNEGGTDSVYMYDVDARTWNGPAATMPIARGYHGMVHIPPANGVGRGQVMVAGGQDSGGHLRENAVYMYDVDADTWNGPAATMPIAMFHFGMVHIPSAQCIGSGWVMVAGGETLNGVNLDSVYMYNVDAKTWSGPAAAMPVARREFGIVHIPSVHGTGRGQVMVAGGDNGGKLDSVYMYNVDADTWSGPAAALPFARDHLGMVCIPSQDTSLKGQVMVAGGHKSGEFFDSVSFSTPVTTTPTTTPVTTTNTTTTTIVTTTSTTAARITTKATTTINTSSTTRTTATRLSVNAQCNPIADLCDSSNGLTCSADVYECRYDTATLQSQLCPACNGSGSCADSKVGVAVLVVLLVMSLAANGWFEYKNRDMAKQLQLQLAAQELGGGRRQTVEMVANPLARWSSGPQPSSGARAARRAAAEAAIPPQEQSALAYSEPASNGVQTYGGAATSYAPVYAVYAGTTASTSAAGMPLDSDNYVLDTSA